MAKNDIETRLSILKAARKEFAERGFQGARMAKIAENAKVNKALIHYYFKNKDGLYMEVLDRMVNNPDVRINIPIYQGNIDLTNPERLYLLTYFIVIGHLRCYDAEENSILLWEIAEGGDFLGRVYSRYIADLSEKILNMINRGIESGDFYSKFPGLVIMGLKNMIDALIHETGCNIRHTPFEKAVKPQTEEDYLDFFLDYTFSMMSPDNRKLQIPQLPKEIISYLDQLIEIMKETGKTRELNDKIISFIAGNH